MPGSRSDSDLSLEIDSSLLQEAMDSVDRNTRRAAPAADRPGEVIIDLELDAPDLAGRAGPVPAKVQDGNGAELQDARGAEPPEVAPAAPPAATPASAPASTSRPPSQPAFPAEERQRWLMRQLEQTDRIRRLEKELKQVRDERDDLRGQAEKLRSNLEEKLSEFEMSRQRQRKDREEAERVAEERAIKPFLDVVDNLERAFNHAVRDAGRDPAKVLDGLKMILDQYNKLLKRAGAERVEAAKGLPFDPEIHEAILHMPHAELPEGSVVEEVSAGFRLKGRLIRPARVVVAAAA